MTRLNFPLDNGLPVREEAEVSVFAVRQMGSLSGDGRLSFLIDFPLPSLSWRIPMFQSSPMFRNGLLAASMAALLLIPVTGAAQAPEGSITPYLSAEERQIYRRAFDATLKRDWAQAQSLSLQGRDPAARRLIHWRFLLGENSGASFVEIDAFLKNNPDWPSRNLLLTRAEQAMPATLAPAEIVAWFAGRAPKTGIGKIRLGHALIESRQTEAGREMIRSAWTTNMLQSDQESWVLAQYGNLLTPALHAARLDGQIWRDETSAAKRQMARVDADAKRIAEARLALREAPTRGLILARTLPGRLASNPGLQFDMARVYRARGDTETAAGLLQQVAVVENKTHPEKMWNELNITARQAVGEGKFRLAYKLTSNSGLSDGGAFADAEFFAGWVALTYLKEPRAALTHFQRLASGVSRPISLSRAYFWSGRAAEAMGDRAGALDYYRKGGQFGETFYGQLALSQAEAQPTLRLQDATPQRRSRSHKFDGEELVRTMRVLADLGEEPLLRLFANHYVGLNPDIEHMAHLAQLMVDNGNPEIAVRVAKQAGYQSISLLSYAFPVVAVPPHLGAGATPEAPLVLGLIRQETEFDFNPVSRAGAMGIMQLMPATARRMAAELGLGYDQKRLLTDTRYNMQLGMLELQKQLDNWGGSYILAAAAYNAGPGNVRKWVAKFGDPRDGTIDPVNWIENIPFGETRNYVQRVLENVQVYRNRLAGADQPMRIMADLFRPSLPRDFAQTVPPVPVVSAATQPGQIVPQPKSMAGFGLGIPLPQQKPD